MRSADEQMAFEAGEVPDACPTCRGTGLMRSVMMHPGITYSPMGPCFDCDGSGVQPVGAAITRSTGEPLDDIPFEAHA